MSGLQQSYEERPNQEDGQLDGVERLQSCGWDDEMVEGLEGLEGELEGNGWRGRPMVRRWWPSNCSNRRNELLAAAGEASCQRGRQFI